MIDSILTVILAAGKGTRMHSNLPKVMHTIAGKPMIFHILDTLGDVGISNRSIIHGYKADDLRKMVDAQYDGISWHYQAEQLGTGHAVMQAADAILKNKRILVLLGDAPLIEASTLESFIKETRDSVAAVLTARVENPHGYGRVIKSGDQLTGIVEEKDLLEDQKSINEINTGIMIFDADFLTNYLPKLNNNNAQTEYYLTDLIALAFKDKLNADTYCVDDAQEVAGINNKRQLAAAESYLRNKTNNRLLENGLTLIDPERFDLQGKLVHGKDVVIEPNVMIKGNVTLGDSVVIEMGCILQDCRIDDGTHILAHSIIEEAEVGKNCQIGPLARLRPQTVLQDNVKIGNFVEIKKSKISQGSKVNHLSYIGDAELGSGINIGAGTITCNYDGANKHKTIIEDNVFIGSNTALVAPLTIHSEATVGAGSVITKDVNKGTLAFKYTTLVERENWQRPNKESK